MEVDTNNFQHNVLLKIAQDAAWLLMQHDLCPGLQVLHNRYILLLANQNLATYRGRVLINDLLRVFQQHYPPDLLHHLGCDIDENSEHNWLARLVRSSTKTMHPIYHLLLIHFLGYTAETFFQLPNEPVYFGEGPWPCLNSLCEYYRKDNIQNCQVAYIHGGRPIGTFACESCGFVYTRTGPDRTPGGRFYIGKIKSFGPLWEETLKKLWSDPNVSLREAARQLGVDPHTVKFQACKLGLSVSNHSQINVEEANPPLPSLEEDSIAIGLKQEYRETWLDTRISFPDAGMRELRSHIPATYIWLYRNDKNWLQLNKPPRKKNTLQTPQRVDWAERDYEIAKMIKSSAERLKTLPGRPVKITIAAVGRDIGRLALLQQHLDKLPQTATALAQVIETREAFAVRRLGWAVDQYQREGLRPKRWQLIRRAGLGRTKDQSSVKNAIDIAMKYFDEFR